jgi:hypothetical protein
LKPGEASVLNNYAVSRMLAGDYAGAKRLFAQAEANGASNPKLAGNLAKLIELNPQPAPQPASPAPTPQKAVTQAAVPQQTVAQHATPAAPPVSVKSNVTVAAAPPVHASAPAPTKDSHPTSPVRVAVAPPKALGGQVVMQRVPHDPLAGPVHAHPTKMTSKVVKPAAVAKKSPQETPSLRTAADAN